LSLVYIHRLLGVALPQLPMETLRKTPEEAGNAAVAIGHFNILDLIMLIAVFDRARDLNVPVMVGASDGERGLWAFARSLQ
jgi:fructose/tagatose bisphosphate aldolase